MIQYTQFHDLSSSDRLRAILSATKWRNEHSDHVSRIVAGGSPYIRPYPPSGSDIFRPELWKPAMWRWLEGQG